MYARTVEQFEESISDFKMQVGHEGYEERIEDFLERKEEWAKLFRDYLIMRGHHTNNLAEATMRILKDIILERVKAYNVVALLDYTINVWNTYLEAKIMKISHKLDNSLQLLYHNLLSRMDPKLAEKIVQVDYETFIVPSAVDEIPTYEVNTTIGTCLCKAGTSGAFCKHQALVHSRFGGFFPNSPAISSYDRYQLGKLALGDKCPAPTFFLDMQEDPSIVENWDLEATTAPLKDIDQREEETEGPIPVPTKRKYPDNFSDDQKKEIVQDFMQQWERLCELGGEESNFYKYLKTSTQSMKKLKTSSSATAVALRVSAVLTRNTRRHRRAKIGVQVTTPARRVSGAPHTRRRLPAGRRKESSVTHGCSRPSVGRPNQGDTRTPKRRHVLSQSVTNNVRHVKKH